MTTNQAEPLSCVGNYENLLASGTRNLICKEIQLSVNQLQEACAIISKKYGETADECADAYFQYGVSLLELSRMESDVLGNALQGITEEETSAPEGDSFVEPDGTSEEEKEKISEEILDAMLEPSAETAVEFKAESTDESKTEVTAESKTESIDTVTDKSSTTAESAIASKMTEGELKTEGESPDESIAKSTAESEAVDNKEDAVAETSEEQMEGDKQDSEEDGNGEEEEEEENIEGEEVSDDTQQPGTSGEKADDEDDVSNIQLAWEMLELAKTIYKRREEKLDEITKKDCLLKQADCLMKLGEVSMETEQYLQSVEDFNSCREILEKVVEPNHRRLAEIHYQLGLALSYACLFNEAVIAYKQALILIMAKMDELTRSVDSCADGAEKEGIVKEIDELKELMPDIRMKIEDAEEEQRSAPATKEAVIEEISSEQIMTSEDFSASTTTCEDDRPAKNISHLVRKKRKPDEDEAETSLDDSNKKHKKETSIDPEMSKLKDADFTTTAAEVSKEAEISSEYSHTGIFNTVGNCATTNIAENLVTNEEEMVTESCLENKIETDDISEGGKTITEASAIAPTPTIESSSDSIATTAIIINGVNDQAFSPVKVDAKDATNMVEFPVTATIHATLNGDHASMEISEDTTNSESRANGAAAAIESVTAKISVATNGVVDSCMANTNGDNCIVGNDGEKMSRQEDVEMVEKLPEKTLPVSSLNEMGDACVASV